ncbi:carbon-nitrogen hydrolase family protein [Alisedimentitalea sp. MJ-SS2]|uniref:carbon-nitrogen hydrolase family protein n=1 Tax=Aliisedimentitalea sp. MJ-SS2 TaxID=3049795 RepID=UPI0029083F32|nr:carbon-nitrogen hydrolase family protein [Alisedimentitalea sp. MJ-SS2]MDU8926856.1 carbon-nitrogen hydrolase family protein [Alisedimentitalea sp. MJ-SS2]
MSFRLAVLQAPGNLPDVAARLAWLDEALAGLMGKADLAVCPELFATGYNIGDEVRKRAEPANGAIAKTLADMARYRGVALHCGFAERDGDKIYNLVQCYGRDGVRMVSQRKLAIPPGIERDYYTPGQGCALFDFMGLKVASLICYDIEFVEPARHVAGLGAGLILAPTALGAQWGWVSRSMVPSRAYENGVYLAYTNHCGVDNGLDFLGESFVAAPDGQELARAGAGEETLIVEIDPARVEAAQARLPYVAECNGLRLE